MDWNDALDTLSTAVNTLRTLLDMTRELPSPRTVQARAAAYEALEAELGTARGAVGDVQQALLEIQQRLFAAVAKEHETEKEIVRLKDWHVQREHYETKALGPDATVYVLKAPGDPEAAPHHLCAHCFENTQRSILQFAGHEGALRVLACPRCGAQVRYRDAEVVSRAARVLRQNRFDGLP